MNQSAEAIATHSDLSALLIEQQHGLSALTAEELVRINFLYPALLRRLETVFIQGSLGTIDAELTEGFETSMLSVSKRDISA
jgi:hypothetical protein